MSLDEGRPDEALESRPPVLPSDSTTSFPFSFEPDEQPILLDNYRIVRKLGEGGMGIVFEAEQYNPPRHVAIKIIRGGPFAGERAERLFRREIRALARLRHPGIAAIYESGKTAAGQNFYAMELASGKSLDAYFRDEDRSAGDPLRRRLELFQRIAAAISYAHQRGVIHRDLKPSNILVAGDAELKVLDFGLARVTELDTGEQSLMTQTSRVEGTLAYMSPEQVRGNPEEVDLRTDVYSLGLILYGMICGRPPYDVQRMALPEASQIICEQAPRPMTTSLTRSRKVDRDLETIVLCALEKEPARRYQSVAEMAEDVRRYAADEPVVARAPSALYHLRKMVVRHRVGAGFSLTLLVVLVVASVALAIQARRIEREAETTRRVSQFMVDLFQKSDPGETRGRTLTVREVLETGAKRIATELKDEPAEQSRLQLTIGSALKSLSLYGEARAQLDASLATSRRVNGENSTETAEVYDELGETLFRMGRYSEALDAARKAVAIHRSRLGNRDPRTAESIHRMALVLANLNKFEEADSLYREAVLVLERTKGPDSVEIAPVLNDWAALKLRTSEMDQAESLARHALAIRRKAYPDGHRSLAYSLERVAAVLKTRGDYRQAEQYTRETLAMRERLFGPGSDEAMLSVGYLADVLSALGKQEEVAALYRRALETDQKVLGPNHPRVARDLCGIAFALQGLNRLDEAEPLYRRALEIYVKVNGEVSRQTAILWNNLAGLAVRRKNFLEAEQLYQKSIDIKIRTDGESHPDTAETRVALGGLYVRRGRLREAEGLLRTGVDDMLKTLPASPRTANLLTIRADYYQKTDRPNEAERDYQKALEIVKSRLPEQHPLRVAVEKEYSVFEASRGR